MKCFRRLGEFARIPLRNFDHLKALRVDIHVVPAYLVRAFMRAFTLGLPPCSHSSSGQQQISTPQAPRSSVSRTVCDFRRPLQAVTSILIFLADLELIVLRESEDRDSWNSRRKTRWLWHPDCPDCRNRNPLPSEAHSDWCRIHG